MDNLRAKAKQLKDEGAFIDAVFVYEQVYQENNDKWIWWEYAYCLKKLGRHNQALQISKGLYFREKAFKYNNNLLAWILYEIYFKNMKETYSYEEVIQLYNIALFVSELELEKNNSPSNRMFLKTLRILKRDNSKYENEMYKLLNKIDYHKLSTEPGTYIDRKGNVKEYQSDKEMYYAYKTKVLHNKEKYDECIVCCEEALREINAFHHDNDIWIKYRKALCIGKTGDISKAIAELEEILIIKTHWIILAEIAKLYQIAHDEKTALSYFCRAAITNTPPRMKVSLYYDMSSFLNNIGQVQLAYLHLLFSINIRSAEGWNIPDYVVDLMKVLKKREEENIVKIDILKKYWISVIYNELTPFTGNVIDIHKNGKFGFIKHENNSYYFKTDSVVSNSKIRKNDRVKFCIVESFDRIKSKTSTEAVYITVDNTKKNS